LRTVNSYDRTRGTSTDGPFQFAALSGYCPPPERYDSQHRGRFERDNMKILKSQAFRALLALSMLASSALVLEAGKRWC